VTRRTDAQMQAHNTTPSLQQACPQASKTLKITRPGPIITVPFLMPYCSNHSGVG